MPNLVLSRKPGEKIMIGESIIITLLSHEKGYSRISIDAPREVAIHRQEIFERIIDKKPVDLNKALTEISYKKRRFKLHKNLENKL